MREHPLLQRRLPYSRRCTKCKYDESPTAGTMFDKCKFSILIAFHIAFKISTKKKGMSSEELSEGYELRQKTCWEFKWKIQQAMKSSGLHPLTGKVHVDEFYVGRRGGRGCRQGQQKQASCCRGARDCAERCWTCMCGSRQRRFGKVPPAFL